VTARGFHEDSLPNWRAVAMGREGSMGKHPDVKLINLITLP